MITGVSCLACSSSQNSVSGTPARTVHPGTLTICFIYTDYAEYCSRFIAETSQRRSDATVGSGLAPMLALDGGAGGRRLGGTRV